MSPADFPNLSRQNSAVTSPDTPEYNCIAWAAGETDRWWEPHRLAYWPSGVALEYKLESYVEAFATLGYAISSSGDESLDPGVEKVAIYVDQSGIPTHMARQLPTGRWTSKLGKTVDIEHHDLSALVGPCYGVVAVVLTRGIVVS